MRLHGYLVDSDILFQTLLDMEIFSHKQLYDAWNNHKLPTPDWL